MLFFGLESPFRDDGANSLFRDSLSPRSGLASLFAPVLVSGFPSRGLFFGV